MPNIEGNLVTETYLNKIVFYSLPENKFVEVRHFPYKTDHTYKRLILIGYMCQFFPNRQSSSYSATSRHQNKNQEKKRNYIYKKDKHKKNTHTKKKKQPALYILQTCIGATLSIIYYYETRSIAILGNLNMKNISHLIRPLLSVAITWILNNFHSVLGVNDNKY